MLETAGNVAGTRHAIALKPRENYCNLERLHNRNQPFLRVYRNFISLHINYVVQWLCKYMLNCQPIIDYQLVRRHILLSYTMIAKDIVEDNFGVQEVCAKDGVDGRQGTTEVFGHEVRRDAAGEGSAAIGKGR